MGERWAVVLAAGKGTRMKSDRPKVLLEVCGRPMVEFVLDALEQAGVSHTLVVVGYQGDRVRAALKHRRGVEFVDQTEQLGTGHAVEVCRPRLERHEGPLVVLAGDSPLVQPSSLTALLDEFQRTHPACLLGTLRHEQPRGLGRILRDRSGRFLGIVEEKDATREQRQINEVNMSTYVFDCRELLAALAQLSNHNQQGEYYLTDCPGILLAAGKAVAALPVLKPCEALSINTIEQLERVESEMRRLGY